MFMMYSEIRAHVRELEETRIKLKKGIVLVTRCTDTARELRAASGVVSESDAMNHVISATNTAIAEEENAAAVYEIMHDLDLRVAVLTADLMSGMVPNVWVLVDGTAVRVSELDYNGETEVRLDMVPAGLLRGNAGESLGDEMDPSISYALS